MNLYFSRQKYQLLSTILTCSVTYLKPVVDRLDNNFLGNILRDIESQFKHFAIIAILDKWWVETIQPCSQFIAMGSPIIGGCCRMGWAAFLLTRWCHCICSAKKITLTVNQLWSEAVHFIFHFTHFLFEPIADRTEFGVDQIEVRPQYRNLAFGCHSCCVAIRCRCYSFRVISVVTDEKFFKSQSGYSEVIKKPHLLLCWCCLLSKKYLGNRETQRNEWMRESNNRKIAFELLLAYARMLELKLLRVLLLQLLYLLLFVILSHKYACSLSLSSEYFSSKSSRTTSLSWVHPPALNGSLALTLG